MGVRDRIECGHADCPSVSPGVAVSGESDIGGFFGGSTTVCGRCNLRVAGLILLFGAELTGVFSIEAACFYQTFPSFNLHFNLRNEFFAELARYVEALRVQFGLHVRIGVRRLGRI